jgi:hypothetical protein
MRDFSAGRYGDDIVAMAQELQRLRDGSFDVVAPTASLKAIVTENWLPSQIRATEVELEVPEHGAYPLTRHGHTQLAEKTGIPYRYYEAMRVTGMQDLLAANVNAWLAREKGNDRRLIRVADGHVRAVLGAMYRVLDNFDLAMLTMDRAKEHGAVVQQCDLTETRMYVKLTVPDFREAIKRGDDVVGGLVVSNSEVGDGMFRVEPFLYRLVCSNGLIGTDALYKVHVGQRLEMGRLIYRDDTRRLADAALWSQVKDIIDATFDQTVLRELVLQLRGTTAIEVEKPSEVTDAVVKDLSLSEKQRDALIRYFAKEGDTVYGLVNGITRLAQDFELAEDQVRLERYAGQIVAGKVKVVA